MCVCILHHGSGVSAGLGSLFEHSPGNVYILKFRGKKEGQCWHEILSILLARVKEERLLPKLTELL